MKTGKRLIGLSFVILIAVVSALVLTELWQASLRETESAQQPAATPVDRLDADAILDDALARAPFPVRIPQWLPPGFELANVQYLGPAPEDEPSADFAVDLYYRNRDGVLLHIWETNIQELEKDPLLDPRSSPLNIDGSDWGLIQLDTFEHGRSQLAHRFADGVLVALDASLTEPDLLKVAASLR
jgi:hypothetical protein